MKFGIKKVYGVGINDSTTPVQLKNTEGKIIWRCPFYTKWANMLKRCYSNASLKERPSYEKSTVCDEWLLFSNFKEWMLSQDYEGKCLDKDLLGNSIEYSPSVCVFIDDDVNSFIKTSVNKFGLPTGISENGCGSYVASVFHDRKRTHLGTFKTKEEALSKYLEAKRVRALELFSDRGDFILNAVLRRFDENRVL